jgi:uncharacterized repeat protein (TIGR03803 family)
MRTSRRPAWLFFLSTILAAAPIMIATPASAQEKILHSFGSKIDDGSDPVAALVFDTNGNLYGTTKTGGADGFGTVFELSPAADGDWGEKVLFSFHRIRPGVYPEAGVVLDSAGNLYGTAYESGTSGKGVVFELKHWPDGGWSEEVLHDFGAPTDGWYPAAGLIFDSAGNLYGTTLVGGAAAFEQGTVFELSPAVGGGWTETVIHSFPSGLDGATLKAGLIFDGSGNLYGTTTWGFSTHWGTVFELTPAGDGTWSEKLLHSFAQNDGNNPQASLIFDAAGNLYSTTVGGGSYGLGTVFELSPSGGEWTETVIHNFGEAGWDSHPWPA